MAVAPELIPEGELVLTRLLVPFMWLCCCIVGLAVANGADTFARAFFGTVNGAVGWIPFLGRIASRPIEAIAHKLNSYIAGWEHYFDKRIGESFHSLAQLLHVITRDTYDTGETLYFAARRIDSLLARLEHVGASSRAQGRHAVTQAQVKPIVRTVHEHTARLAHTAPAAVMPRLGRLEGELGHVIEWDIPRLRARTRTIEKSLDRLWHRVKGVDKLVVTTAFVGAVAVALGRMGLGWLRCNALRDLGKRVGCGGFKLLEELLAGVIDVLVIADLCQLTKLLIDVAESSEVQTVIAGIIDGMDALLLCQEVERPAALDGYWTDPPPLQAYAALPAA